MRRTRSGDLSTGASGGFGQRGWFNQGRHLAQCIKYHSRLRRARFACIPIERYPPQFQPHNRRLIHMHELRVHNLPREIAPAELAGSTVVVIDLLRAISTICQALAAGATEVVPFLEVEDAVAAAADDRAKVILGGERGGQRIDGFDLGNSPSEYTPGHGGRQARVSHDHQRHARARITRGSRARGCGLIAEPFGRGGVSSRRAAGRHYLCRHRGRRIAGRYFGSRGDRRAIGGPRSRRLAIDEAATVALAEWRCRGDDLAVELRSTPGGRNLLSIGMDRDLVIAPASTRCDRAGTRRFHGANHAAIDARQTPPVK